MANRCQICGKEPHSGYQFTRRGLAKSKGGVGRKTTGHTKRTFLPNLQSVKTTTTSKGVKRVRVCAKCLRSGKVARVG
jgi:large subunit ribosomal protein L28